MQIGVFIPIGNDRDGWVRCDAAIFSPGGRMLASSQVSEYQGIRPSYGDALLRLWERTSGRPIRTRIGRPPATELARGGERHRWLGG